MTTTTVAVATMKVAQIAKPGAGFQVIEREIPEPGTRQVRIKVQACGVCHSDVLVKEGVLPWIQYPRVPGHELPGSSTKLDRASQCGRRGSESESAGMAGTTAPAGNAGAETFGIAET